MGTYVSNYNTQEILTSLGISQPVQFNTTSGSVDDRQNNWAGRYPVGYTQKPVRQLSDPALARDKITTNQRQALTAILAVVKQTADARESRGSVQVLHQKLWPEYRKLIAEPVDLGSIEHMLYHGEDEAITTPYIVVMELESSRKALWLVKDNYSPVGLPNEKKTLPNLGGAYSFTLDVKLSIKKSSMKRVVLFDRAQTERGSSAIERGWNIEELDDALGDSVNDDISSLHEEASLHGIDNEDDSEEDDEF
ncbi:hypothetical protein diail_11097 [Diaporthe ilicicola]|nr:hypothetical protein diail_11097 [Diaporthe ilicicola]